MGVAVLMPVKAFASAKARLAPALGPVERETLVRQMADQVLAAARPLPTFVVCDDPSVAEWARSNGAEVLWSPGLGLNGAVTQGVGQLRDRGFERVMVVHADLPLAPRGSLEALPVTDGATFVPDRRDDGTNVAIVPTDVDFIFCYGPGSFSRHCREAERLGLRLTVVRDADLAWDVDTPADLVASP